MGDRQARPRIRPGEALVGAVVCSPAVGGAGPVVIKSVGDGVDRAELTSLRMLYQDPAPDSSNDVASRLEALNRRLCSDIRQGGGSSRVDEKRLRDHLRRSVAARVAISNPKALKV